MLGLFLISALTTMAPTGRPAPAPDIIVSAAWLRTHVKDPNLVVLDLTIPGTQSPDPYNAGHVPGARQLGFHSIFAGGGNHGNLSMELVSADSLRNVLEGLGVSDRSTIVLYGTSREVSHVARAYVTLDYLGLGAHTHILNGGYDAWKAAGGAVETASPSITRGELRATSGNDVVTNGAYVMAHVADKSMTIVDARAPEFYNGTVRGHSAARTGHIPGARNVYFLTLADSTTSKYVAPEQVRERFAAAGVRLDRPVVVYCHIGQTASVDYVQLRRLGVPVRLYDGSFEDWSRNNAYPVVNSSTP